MTPFPLRTREGNPYRPRQDSNLRPCLGGNTPNLASAAIPKYQGVTDWYQEPRIISTSTHPTIVLSDSNVEDAFSSTTTPDYNPASPDYSPASPGNTSSDPSEDLSKDILVSLTISPFHDDSYVKVMQAYNTTNNESPIPLPQAPIAPPTVLLLSLVLPPSPLFDSRYFFLPKEILPPQKRARFLSSFSTDFSAPPQIDAIMNHLDELPLERIEHMEDKIEGLGNG
ncbi:hypothetical protein Tco_1545198, partial [Tanacetum coccineum]